MKNNHKLPNIRKLSIIACSLLIPLITTLAGCATAVDYTLLSKTAYEQDRYEDAINNANLAIKDNPDFDYSWLWLGLSQLKANQYQDAITSLKKAKQLNSSTEFQKSTTYNIGYAYYRMSDCDSAISFFNQNIAIEADSMSYLHRSYCYMEKGMFDEALSDAHHVTQDKRLKPVFQIQAQRVMSFSQLGLDNAEKSLSIINQLQNDFSRYDAWRDLVAIAEITNNSKQMSVLLLNRGWIGLESIDYFKHKTHGAEVDSFVYNNPNSKSKLLPGDIIISVNDTPITSAKDLNKAIKVQKPGHPVLIKAQRLIKKSANSTQIYTPLFEDVELNIIVKPVPKSVALATLKEHPYHLVIHNKLSRYEVAKTASEKGQHKKSFDLYMASSNKYWLDSDTLGEIIELYWKIGKLTPPSDKNNKDLFFANQKRSEIRTAADLNHTIKLYNDIIQKTPWWADAHNNIASLYEKRKDYLLAVSNLNLYLISEVEDSIAVVSRNSEADKVKKRIFDLEYKANN